jgi:methylenetetrahydrofolate reductase (NADPH)
VKDIKHSGADFCIGGACYPEIHPESPDQKSDIKYLKEKVDAGCEFLTTQMFFDNNLLYNFLYKIREAGITVPVIPGIMPITNAKQVERAISLSGSFMPQRFKSLVDKFGHDPSAMKQAGIAYATDQIIDLYANGITNVHVYSMNNPDVARAIMNNLSEILRKRY